MRYTCILVLHPNPGAPTEKRKVSKRPTMPLNSKYYRAKLRSKLFTFTKNDDRHRTKPISQASTINEISRLIMRVEPVPSRLYYES